MLLFMIAKNIKETMNSKGASVIRKMFEEGRKLKAIHGDDAVFDFSLGNPDLEPPKEVLDAIKDLAQNRQMGDSAYMPNAGLPETRLAIAQKINGEQGISTLTENHVIITVDRKSVV